MADPDEDVGSFDPKFTRYNDIEVLKWPKSLESLSHVPAIDTHTLWCVTEKVHGANLQLATDR